jgi:hypothetical protein
MKFGMDVVPLVSVLKSYFAASYSQGHTSQMNKLVEVGLTLALFTRVYKGNTVMYGNIFSKNTQLSYSNSLCNVTTWQLHETKKWCNHDLM